MNKVILIGNLGADPEVRYTQAGQPVGNFRIATNESWVDKKTGEKQSSTEWHRVTVWGKLAEVCGEHLTKGRLVAVEGKLQTRQYKDKEGVIRYQTEINAARVTFLPNGGKANGGTKEGAASTQGEDQSYDYGPPPEDDGAPPF